MGMRLHHVSNHTPGWNFTSVYSAAACATRVAATTVANQCMLLQKEHCWLDRRNMARSNSRTKQNQNTQTTKPMNQRGPSKQPMHGEKQTNKKPACACVPPESSQQRYAM